MKIVSIITFILYLSLNLYGSKIDQKEHEQLKLMYDSFIFAKDLDNAYKVAKRALKLKPDSIYWHRKLGEVALWLGKNEESLKHLKYVYKETNDKKLGNLLRDRLYDSYRYEESLPFVKERLQKGDYSSEDLLLMQDLYDKVGRPHELIDTLQELYDLTKEVKYLGDILSIYLRTGEIDKGEDISQILDQEPDKSVKIASTLSKYYFLKKDLKKAFKVLLEVKSRADLKDVEYFKQLSDLGWHLKRYKQSVYGSRKLYQSNNARLEDYQRIFEFYQKSRVDIIEDISIGAIYRLENLDFFLEYAYKRVQKRDFDNLDRVIKRLLSNKKSRRILQNSPKFWLIKATVDSFYRRDGDVKKDLLEASKLDSDSLDINREILWHLIDSYDYERLEKEIQKIESRAEVPKTLLYPVSASYLSLQKPDRAMVYIKKALKNDPKNIEYLSLYAWILSAQGRDIKKREKLKEIYTILREKLGRSNYLLSDGKFMRDYLRVYLEFNSKKEFNELLDLSKKYLLKSDYDQLKLLYYMKYRDYKEASLLLKSMHKPNPITAMEVADLLGDKEELKILMDRYPDAVPIRVKIKSAKDRGEIDRAILLSKLAVEENRKNRYLRRDLSRLYRFYGNHFDLNLGYKKEGKLNILESGVKALYYLGSGFVVEGKVSRYMYRSKKLLNSFNLEDIFTYLTIRKSIVDGNIEAGISYRDTTKNSIGSFFKVDRVFAKRLYIEFKAEDNFRAEDMGIYMLVAGKRDSVSLLGSYTLSPKQNISLMGEYLGYSTLDSIKVGSGYRVDVSWSYMLRVYLDSNIRLFYSKGEFKESGYRGTILDILPQKDRDKRLIESSYQNIGVGYHINGFNSHKIGVDLEPYLDLSALYSDIDHRLHADIEAGFITSTNGKNLFRVNIKYQNKLNNIGKKKLGINFSYSHLY